MAKNLPNEVKTFLTDSKESYTSNSLEIKFTEDANSLREIAKNLLFQKVKPFYEERELAVNYAVFNFLLEPLKNANFHGGKEKEHTIILGLYLSSLGLAASYFDGGSYFKRKEIKKCWEKRYHFPEKNKVANKEIGFGVGTGLIYNLADLIYVDLEQGVLYTGLSVGGKYLIRK